ncbi:CTP--phosphocholine cytidylyltransferase, partial [Clostridium perfringens]
NLYNNVYTMYLIRDYLEDAYVTEADVYMVNNYFDENINSSAYFTGVKENFEKEWKVIFDGERVVNLKVEGGTGYIMSGISFWNKEDGIKIKKRLEEVVESENFKDVYWDDVVSPMLKEMSVTAKKIKTDDWFEIDSVEDLNNAEEYLRNKNI